MGGMPEVSRSRFAWPVRRRQPSVPAGPEGTAEDIAVQDIAELEAADRRLPPPLPTPMVDPPPRFNLAMFRLAALGLALVLALALTVGRIFVGGPPSVAELRAQAGVDTWGVLPIGVKDDQPGTAFRDENGVWSGFDIDIAYMIAEDLGFRQSDVRFYAMESEDRARMQATDAKGARVPVKMVIASFSITQARIDAGVRFSAPYLYTEQSVMTLPGHDPVSTWRDLKGTKVCSLSSSTSASAATDAGVYVLSRNKISECFADLDHHDVTAVTTDAAILAGYKAKYPTKYTHWDLGLDGVEKWGVNVGDNKALQKLVDLTLYRSLKDPKDGRWERAYRTNLQSEVARNKEGDKFIPIAVAEQPNVDRPDIRDLPWEDVFP
jgi:ABC-type amino acid transport substrate-binding protein